MIFRYRSGEVLKFESLVLVVVGEESQARVFLSLLNARHSLMQASCSGSELGSGWQLRISRIFSDFPRRKIR
ncbi:hypothetical protein F511_41302 [Dorcoceras hygrometricum]|uniref:Uncharacterized protein n=1 Tax=Dorcoceras hygrometricum TaxID=472368 RepID=A0A2Z7BL33_9LAMI|nr:hypothetical protein F511_41302 [Dorcoceras hygrometricum]